MKNIYIGDAVKSSELRREYDLLFEDMSAMIFLSVNEDILEILIFEDYRMSNNPFSDITTFPLNVTFSFSKLVQGEKTVTNLWEINMPLNIIERITEEYEDDIPGHQYSIVLKNDSQIRIIGKYCLFSEDGRSCLFDPEDEDLIHTQCDVYNKIYITGIISEKEILINFLNRKLENEKYFLGRITNPIRKVDARRKISEIRDRLRNLDNDDLQLDMD